MADLTKKKLVRNFSFAFLAQGVSYVLSVITGLVVPKMLGIDEFGYWQLFIFYGSYVNFCMLGAHDGMYLRLGGAEYKKLDYVKEGSQFRYLMAFELLLAVICVIAAFIFISDPNRKYVAACIGVYLILINACQYLGELFQAVNETHVFSIATIINKLIYMLLVALLLMLRVTDFRPYVLGLIFSTLVSLIYYVVVGRKIIFLKSSSFFVDAVKNLKNIVIDAKSGWKIMIGGYAAMLIIGSGRNIIDVKWGISTFGKLAMAISLINMAMQFINQVAIVLFPALRTVDDRGQERLYVNAKEMLFFILPLIYFAYIPLSWFISVWLPQYSDSIKYLAVLLPICVFDAKTNMLSMTYMKVLRKENKILEINLISLCLNLTLIGTGIFLFGDIYVILIAMVVSVVVRNILFDIYIGKIYKIRNMLGIIFEIILMSSFIIVNLTNARLLLFVLIIEYLVLIIIEWKKILTLKRYILKAKNKEKKK